MNAPVTASLLSAAQVLDQVTQSWDDDIVHRMKDYGWEIQPHEAKYRTPNRPGKMGFL